MRDCARPLSLRFMILAFAIAAFALALPSGMAYAQDAQLGAASSALEAQNASYQSPDGLVEVGGISEGNVSYDEESATLTLDSVHAGSVVFRKDGEVTLNLVGSNSLNVLDDLSYWEYSYNEENGIVIDEKYIECKCTGSVRLTGEGTLNGQVMISGDLAIEEGATLTCKDISPTYCYIGYDEDTFAVSCTNLSIAGGTLDIGHWYYGYGIAIKCSSLSMTDGMLAVDARSGSYVNCSGTIALKGGTISVGNVKCASLSISGGKMDAKGDEIVCNALTVWGGALNATNIITCLKNFNMKGGTVKAGGVRCGGDVTVIKGKVNASISCSKLTMKGGTVKAADGVYCGGNITVVKGKVNAPISCSRLTVKGGQVVLSNRKDVENAIYCENLVANGGKIALTKLRGYGTAIRCGKLAVQGGKVSVGGCDGVGVSCGNLNISKGSLIVDDQYGGDSVRVVGGNLVMTGGVLKVTRSYEDAVSVEPVRTGGASYRGKTTPVKLTGGFATVKGGSVTVGVRSPSRNSAIAARSFAGKPACVKTARGRMPSGFSFTAGGNTYKIVATNYRATSSDAAKANHWRNKAYGSNGSSGSTVESAGGEGADASASTESYPSPNHLGKYPFVILTKYGATKTKASLGTVKFGSCNYSVSGVGAKAFATPRGAKVKSITFSNTLTRVDANAFAGAKSLEELRLDLFVGLVHKKGAVSSATIKNPSKVAKAALSKCGKAGGKGLTVRIALSGYFGYAVSASPDGKKAQDPRIQKLKAMFVKCGLSKSATVAIWRR